MTIQTLALIDLATVTGGYSTPVQEYIDCHNRAVNTFNQKRQEYLDGLNYWETPSESAMDNFGRELQNNHAACIANHRLRIDTSRGF